MPNLVVIAGPNGAGKSTSAPLLIGKRLGIAEFVNADVIAAELSPSDPDAVAIKAGRIMLKRLDALAAAGTDFSFETTLASRHFAPWIAKLQRERAYRFHVVYLWLPDVEQNILRVAGRVRHGGHNVPPEVIRRRYANGLANFLELYRPIADSWALYDNSTEARLVATRELDGSEEIHDAEAWAMIEKQSKAREQERAYKAGSKTGGIMGVPIDEVTAALRDAGRDDWRRHKALGHSIVIMRDGKVVVVPPEEIAI